VDEKLDTMKRLSDIERSLSNTEDEFSTLKELYDREVDENRKLAEEISRLSTQLEEKIGQDESADVEAPTSDETQNNKVATI
jgi:regulator of replication initiation timing